METNVVQQVALVTLYDKIAGVVYSLAGSEGEIQTLLKAISTYAYNHPGFKIFMSGIFDKRQTGSVNCSNYQIIWAKHRYPRRFRSRFHVQLCGARGKSFCSLSPLLKLTLNHPVK